MIHRRGFERSCQEVTARNLGEFPVAYLFIDGVTERLHAGMPREAVLCVPSTSLGTVVGAAHLAPGTKENTAFFEDLKRRGLIDPLLVVADGASGLIRAVDTCFPRALRQRCLVHRAPELVRKAPDGQWPGDRDSGAADP